MIDYMQSYKWHWLLIVKCIEIEINGFAFYIAFCFIYLSTYYIIIVIFLSCQNQKIMLCWKIIQHGLTSNEKTLYLGNTKTTHLTSVEKIFTQKTVDTMSNICYCYRKWAADHPGIQVLQGTSITSTFFHTHRHNQSDSGLPKLLHVLHFHGTRLLV